MTTTTVITDDSIITTTIRTRYVDWDDIEVTIVADRDGQTPWGDCDSWPHEFEQHGYSDHDDRKDHYSRVGRNGVTGQHGYVVITDEQVKRFYSEFAECSKQVRSERIAQAKRIMTEQLVHWYSDGWEPCFLKAEYGDYVDYLSGFYSYEDAESAADDVKAEVAAQLADDGYIVDGQPETVLYTKTDRLRDKIKRQLGGIA